MDEKRGKFLLELRKSKNLSQEQLGEIIHYSRNNISKWERGISFPGDPNVLHKLSSFFNVGIEELMYGERKNESNNQLIMDNLVNDAMNNYKKNIRKNIALIVSFLLTIIIIMILLYFVFIKGSVSYYKISLESNDFFVDNASLLISNKKAFLSFGNVSNSNNNIKKIDLYYIDPKTDKKVLIFTSNNNDLFVEEKPGYEEYGLFKMADNDVYIDITTDKDYYEYVKVKLTKIYTNNNIFPNKVNKISDTKTFFEKNNNRFKILNECGFSSIEDDNVFFKSINGNVDIYISYIEDDYSTFLIKAKDSSFILSHILYKDNVEYIKYNRKGEEIKSSLLLRDYSEIDCNKNECISVDDYIGYINYLEKRIQ